MPNVSEPGGRRLRLDGLKRHTLRGLLMEQFRQTRRYQYIVQQDLRPFWNELLRLDPKHAAYLHPDRHPAFEKLLTVMDDRLKDLKLVWQGRPVDWASRFIMADVIGKDEGAPSYDATYPIDAARLDIEITPADARLQLVSALLPEGTVRRQINASEPLGFDSWERVRQEAHTLVDDWIERVQAEWKKREDYHYRNTTYRGVPTDEQDRKDVRALADLLLNKGPVDRVLRRRLERLCKTIGLDFPTTT